MNRKYEPIGFEKKEGCVVKFLNALKRNQRELIIDMVLFSIIIGAPLLTIYRPNLGLILSGILLVIIVTYLFVMNLCFQRGRVADINDPDSPDYWLLGPGSRIWKNK